MPYLGAKSRGKSDRVARVTVTRSTHFFEAGYHPGPRHCVRGLDRSPNEEERILVSGKKISNSNRNDRPSETSEKKW